MFDSPYVLHESCYALLAIVQHCLLLNMAVSFAMYVNSQVKNAKNFASQAKTSSRLNFVRHFLNKSKASALVKRLLTASLTESKNACMTEVCSVVKKSYKVQDFVLIPEKRRCSYFRILQLQTVNSIMFCTSVFAYKLLICCVIVSSACNELGVCTALTTDISVYPVLDELGFSQQKL